MPASFFAQAMRPATSNRNYFDAYMPRRTSGLSPFHPNPAAGATNEAGQGFFARYGAMPNRTVGGTWGQGVVGKAHPQSFFDMAHPGYQAMHQAPMGLAPTTAHGYLGQMMNQNPGGRFFQGALPAFGNSSGGNVRPMWMGAPQDPTGGVTPETQNAWAAKNGFYMNHQTGTMSPLSGVQGGMSPHDIRAMQVTGAGPDHRSAAPIARDQRYWNMGLNTPEFRQAGVQANAMAKGQARSDRVRMQRGQLSMEEQMAFGVPGFAVQGLQNANSQAWLQGQMGMFGQKQAMEHQNNQWGHHAAMIQAIPELVKSGAITPQQGQQMMQGSLKAMGMSAGEGGKFSAVPPVGTPQSEAFRRDAMTNPSKAEKDLIAKGATPAEARNAVREINPSHGQQSAWGGIANSPFGWWWGGAAGDAIGGQLDPYGPFAPIFGVHAPPLNRQRRPPTGR